MRIYMLACVVLLVSAQQALAFDQQTLLKVFFSVVLVRGYDADGGLSVGTGVVVGENKVATNCHTLRNTEKVWVSQAEEVYRAESVQADPRHDLCLIHTEKMPLQPVALGNTTSVRKGDEIYALGHSGGLVTPTVSGGQVKSVYPYDNGNIIRTNARFTLGASGSPLIDVQGRLLGINTFKTPGRVAYFYAMPVEWLESMGTMQKVDLPVKDQAFWELPDEQKPFFMQVALPHLNEEWANLEHIGRRWIGTEPGNAEAWYELASALEGLGKILEAENAYRKAVGLDARHAESLYRLGIIAAKRGDRNEVHHVSATLAQLDPQMAEEFNTTAGCQGAC